jgi:drug/metabolite transporter (DMT)-like permease
MNNLRGILLMVVANFLFAIGDMFVKFASGTLIPPQIIFFLGLGAFLTFVPLAIARGEPLFHPQVLTAPVIGRSLAEMVAVYGMITGLALAPLSTVAAILQASPLLVTLLAAMFLGEEVGWRRWLAVILGFVGVLLIVRPGLDGFDANAIYAVIGMIGLSARDFLTRVAPRDLPTSVLASYGVIGLIPLGLIWTLLSDGPALPAQIAWGPVIGMVVFGTSAYFAITLSVRVAEISVVAPFRYSRLVFAMALGVLVFGERPDAPTLIGAAMILCAGLYALTRERKRKDRLHTSPTPR